MIRMIRRTLSDCWGFTKPHWWHLLLIPVMAIGFTALHEGAHALAVVVQGGQMLEFNVIPGGGRYGHVSYTFDREQSFSQFAVLIAPYAMWVGFMIGSIVLAALRRGYPFAVASLVFLWCYIGPWLDILNTADGWAAGGSNDFAHAFGEPTTLGVGAFGVGSVVAMSVGYFVQRRLYGDRAVGPGGYVLLVIGCGLLLTVAILVDADSFVVNR